MLLHTWLPACLRAAGIKVVETPGWTGRSHGQLPGTIRVVWHHDASPPGDSPGAKDWMISNWSTASAQVWIDNSGTWHLIGTGVAWHAGSVLPGMPGNFDSIGIETDQTTGEAWPKAQLDSLRRGTAAIFTRQNNPAGWLHFHKTICDPPGRKVDPTGLDLATERSNVSKLMSGGSTPPPSTTPTPPPAKDWFDMATEADLRRIVSEEIRKNNAAIWDTVMPNNAGGKPEVNQPGRKARDTLAGLMTLANRIYYFK